MKRSRLALSAFLAFAAQLFLVHSASAQMTGEFDQRLESLQSSRSVQGAADYKTAVANYRQASAQMTQACSPGDKVDFKTAQVSVIELLQSVSEVTGLSNDASEIKAGTAYISELNFEIQSMGPWGREGWISHFNMACASLK